MTEPTERPELPEGPWNYDYHGDWSTYALGLEGTVRVEFEHIHENDKDRYIIRSLRASAKAVHARRAAGRDRKPPRTLSIPGRKGDLAAAVNALEDWMKAAQAVVAKAQPTTQGE